MGIIFGVLLGFWLIDLAFYCCDTVEIITVVPGFCRFCYCTVYYLSVISACDDVKKEKQEQCRSLIKPAGF